MGTSLSTILAPADLLIQLLYVPKVAYISSWLGLSLSVIPAAYGFILFYGMGASMIELCFSAMTSSIAAIIWSVNYPTLNEYKTG